MKRLRFLVMFLLPVFLMAPADMQALDKAKKEKKPREKDLISFEFSMNYSLVLGKYGQTDKNTDLSGYAKNGWVGKLGFNWLGKRGWGLGFQYDIQHNGYKDIASTTNPYGTKYVLGTAGWTNNYLMAGPVFITDFGKVELNVKALFGVILAQSTNFNVQNPADQSNVSMSATGFAYSGSIAVGYNFNKHWGVNIQFSYLGGTPKATKSFAQELISWETVKDPVTGITYNFPVYSDAVKKEIKRTVSTINGGIGIIYHL